MACECPAHLRVAFETRDAMRDVARQLKAQNILLDRLSRRAALQPQGLPPQGSPVMRAAGDILQHVIQDPTVKEGLQEFLHGLNAGKKRRR